MIDLEHDIHDYVQAAFESVSTSAVKAAVKDARPSPAAVLPRRRIATRSMLVAAAVVVVAVSGMVGFAWLRSSSTEPGVAPTRQPAMQALTAVGPADCSHVTKAGDSIVLAVTVNGGHKICVVQRSDNSSREYFDGKYSGGSFPRPTPPYEGGGWSFGGLGMGKGRFYVLSNLPNNVRSLRLTFCNGKTLELLPLNSSNPRFVAARYLEKLGQPTIQQIDFNGQISTFPSPPTNSCKPSTATTAVP
jgi:hypothetical protein